MLLSKYERRCGSTYYLTESHNLGFRAPSVAIILSTVRDLAAVAARGVFAFAIADATADPPALRPDDIALRGAER